MTVTYRGQERTLAQMAPFLEETDRAVRQEAWELSAARRLAGPRDPRRPVRPDDGSCAIEVAHEAGFANFVEYAFRNRERFDYGIADSIRFHEAVERVVVPLTREIQERAPRDDGRGVAPPVGPGGRPAGPAAACSRSTTSSSSPRGPRPSSARSTPSSATSSRFLRGRQLLDLANRKGKAPGGYQTTLEDERLPFIFMNAVGLDSDVRTLLHEGGHAFHTLACRGEPLSAYRESPLEFCEVASMTHGAPGRPPARPVLQRRPTPTARPASCSRGSC